MATISIPLTPVSGRQLSASGERFSGKEWHHILMTYEHATTSVQMLYHTAMSITLDVNQGNPAPVPSLVVERDARFRLETINAMIEETPIDLLLLMSERWLPEISDWSREVAFLKTLPDEGQHSLGRHAGTLLRDRIAHGSSTDLSALKELAIILSDRPIVDKVEGPPVVDATLAAAFPAIEARSDELLKRHIELAWRPDEDGDQVVPEHLIGK